MHLQFEDHGVRVVLVPGDPAHVIDGWYTIIDTDAVGTPLLLEYIGLAFDAKAHCIAIKLPTLQERGPDAWRMRYDPSVDAMAVYLTSRASLMRRRVGGRDIDTMLCFAEDGLLLSFHVKVPRDMAVRMQRHWRL